MLTLVIHYYNNARAINQHFDYFSKFSDEALGSFDLLFIDDASDVAGQVDFAALIEHHQLHRLRLRVLSIDEDIPWNQTGARNLGCFEASTDWLFCTDVDHFTPEDCIAKLNRHIAEGLDERILYRVKRRDILTKEMISPHTNTFLINRASFKKVGGYDEDFAGGAGHSDKYFMHLWSRAGNRTSAFDDVVVDVDKRAYTRELSRDMERNRSLYLDKTSGRIPERLQRINFTWRVKYPPPPRARQGA